MDEKYRSEWKVSLYYYYYYYLFFSFSLATLSFVAGHEKNAVL